MAVVFFSIVVCCSFPPLSSSVGVRSFLDIFIDNFLKTWRFNPIALRTAKTLWSLAVLSATGLKFFIFFLNKVNFCIFYLFIPFLKSVENVTLLDMRD